MTSSAPSRSSCNRFILTTLLTLPLSSDSFLPPILQNQHTTTFQRNILLHSSRVDYDDDNDDDAIDSDTLGIYSEEDFKGKTDFEWDEGVDPNDLDPTLEYYTENPVDEEGVQKGWDPLYGPSNPFDERTIITPVESYMIAASSRDNRLVEPMFKSIDDPENAFNEEVTHLRKEMKIIDTFVDPWLNMEVPRNVAPWHGYHQPLSFPRKDFMNNRFTKPEDKTDFTQLDPYRARQKAIELARSNNNEWLPEGYSQEYKRKKVAGFHRLNCLAGSLKEGEKDPAIVEAIQPCLKVLGDAATLLSIQETVFRFRYYGPMKNRRGIENWTKTMIRDCGVNCTGVLFETGGRKKDEWE